MSERALVPPHYRVRRLPGRLDFEVRHVDGDRERPLTSGVVEDPAEAASVAALAILGDHFRGHFPRAWRLVDAFERELAPLNVRDEWSIDVATLDAWIEIRESS